MVSARAAEAEEEGVDEGVVSDGETDYIDLGRPQTLKRKSVAANTNFAITPKIHPAKFARRRA